MRLIAAHMLAGSNLWQENADPLRAAKGEIAESLEANAAHQADNAERQVIMAMLNLERETALDTHRCYSPRPNITTMMIRLSEQSDENVLRTLTFVMIESLSMHSPLIDELGAMPGTEVSKVWNPDETFFALIRDKVILNQMVHDYAGEAAAEGNGR